MRRQSYAAINEMSLTQCAALPKASEHQEQAALIEWAGTQTPAHPDLALLFAIPNGGQRHPAVAQKLKAEGVRAGVPDLCLPAPRHGYFGLFIEMKVKPNKTSPAQNEWLAALEAKGYYCKVCYGFDEARAVLEWYLGA